MRPYLDGLELKLGRKYATPIFDGASEEEVQNELKEGRITKLW